MYYFYYYYFFALGHLKIGGFAPMFKKSTFSVKIFWDYVQGLFGIKYLIFKQGGALGLFTGVSILSMVEICFWILKGLIRLKDMFPIAKPKGNLSKDSLG